MELVKFIVASVGVSNIIAFGFNWIEYFVMGKPELFLCVDTLSDIHRLL